MGMKLNHTYLPNIFDVNISIFANESFDCNLISFSGCNVEGSPLIEKKAKKQKINTKQYQVEVRIIDGKLGREKVCQ